MSGLIVGLVLRTPITEEFNTEAKFVATVYADHAWEDGTHAYPAVDTVAGITGLSSRTVQRYLRVLEEIGMLRIMGKGPRGTNRYDFTLQNNKDGSVGLVLVGGDSLSPRQPVRGDSLSPRQPVRGDSLSPRQPVRGDTESGDTESGDTGVTQTNNPSLNLVVNGADVAKISKLYEREIGALTPLVADSIRDALKDYPADWIEEAIPIAVANNSRRWNYVLAILKNCKDAGKRPSLNRLEKGKSYGNNSSSNSNGTKPKRPTKANNTEPSAGDIAAAEQVKAKKRAQTAVP